MLIILIYFAGNVQAVMRNTVAVWGIIKESVLNVKAYKSKYIIMYRNQNAGLNHGIKTDNSSFSMLK